MSLKIKATQRDYDILRFPVLTEASTKLLNHDAYVFVVDKFSTKPTIKQAVERVFGVKVKSVNTLLMKGKTKVFRGRLGKRADYKKAVIRLEKGDKIDLGVGV